MALLARELLWVGECLERRSHTSCIPFASYNTLDKCGTLSIKSLGREGKVSWGRILKGEKRRRRVAVYAAQESLYETLGVAQSATEKEIKQAYRRLALKYHPDVNKKPDAQEQFLRIKNAYQTLVDERSRSKYNSSRRSQSANWDPFQWDPSPGSRQKTKQEEEFYGFEDFFKDLQSDLRRRESAKKAQAKPKSLWEELADIGEEFVEFLEKELNISDSDEKKSSDNTRDATKENKQRNSKKNENGAKAKASKQEAPTDDRSKVENEIAEIEDMLAKLKKDMGMSP